MRHHDEDRTVDGYCATGLALGSAGLALAVLGWFASAVLLYIGLPLSLAGMVVAACSSASLKAFSVFTCFAALVLCGGAMTVHLVGKTPSFAPANTFTNKPKTGAEKSGRKLGER